MKLFIPFFLLMCVIVIPLAYIPEWRRYVRRHLPKLLLTVAVSLVVLFVLFVAMSTSTWRIF